MFNSTQEGTKDSGGYMSPGIHDNVYIKEVLGHTFKAKSEIEYNVLDITFINMQKETFLLRMFDPAHTADAEKAEKNATEIANKVAYMATKAQGKEVTVTGVNSWDELCAFAVANIPAGNKIAYKLKLNGNVYGGKANVQITSYPGWLKTMASNENIKFSKKENEANAEYAAFMNPQTGGAQAATPISGAPF